MIEASPSSRLDTSEGLDWHLEQLVKLDLRLAPVWQQAGTPAPRINPPGFAGIAKIVCGQQLSVASARAIWSRFELLPGALKPLSYLWLDETQVRASGFSLGKYRTLRVIAEAVVAGELDFAHLETLTAEAATAYLVAHKGIGPWTAQVYLMFCAQHPDVFPAGDLALLKAVQSGLGLEARPSIKALATIAEMWSPHRSAAALLFWRLFASQRLKDGIVL
ncbi:DNA-3-methyladenine glycosylase family protein [uncultured Devosia sp.]|uniref:DNA-3-methyladenine glycosylase family protein n=1 Tax=uncultured Devosia sp. TaxID=211434 RepID=UPI0035CB54DF